jgi:hypothetical protein
MFELLYPLSLSLSLSLSLFSLFSLSLSLILPNDPGVLLEIHLVIPKAKHKQA